MYLLSSYSMPHFKKGALFGAFEEENDAAHDILPSTSIQAQNKDDQSNSITLPVRVAAEQQPHRIDSQTDSTAEDPRVRRTQIKNRRKYYLDTHQDYFSSDLELADPLLYDRLIRRFQSATEREAEGRKKGFSGVLEADIVRSEAKVEALANPTGNTLFNYRRGPNGEILAEAADEVPATKDEAYAQWREAMEWRFMSGEDRDFDYTTVDDNESMDDRKQIDQDEEDAYFDSEEPTWDHEDDVELQGETGVQDF